MSSLRPKFLFNLLSKTPTPSPEGASPLKRRQRRDQLLRMATIFTAFGWSVLQSPSARAAEVSWGSGLNSTPYPVGSGVNANYEAQGIGPAGLTGVNLRFRLDAPAGIVQGQRPIPGNELIVRYLATSAPANADGLVDQLNPNTPLTGGLVRGNILLGIDSPDLTGVQNFSVEFFNAAGDIVPANDVTYTIIDLDRSCNREPDGRILWQDVVSTRVMQGGAAGTPITPVITSGPAAGASGVPGSSSETVANITAPAPAGAAYVPAVGSLTFRGISDPSPEILTAVNGNTECNDGNGAFPADNDDNRGIEAANNLNQPPGQPEGNVSLSAAGRLADRVEFQFGNGVDDVANNGLNEPLRLDPAAHGVGVLGDFSFKPAIIGISETSTAPVFQPAGALAGRHVVKYSLLVENRGEVDLTNVNVTNNLDTTFGAGNYTVVPGSITIDDVAQPDGFNGNSNQVIPIPGTLAGRPNATSPGGRRLVMFEVAFDAAAATAAVGQNFYSNQSVVTANPIDPQTGGASAVYTVRDRSSHAESVAGLNSDVDADDPDDGSAANLPADFANPFNAAPATITRGTAADNDPSNNDSPTIVRVIPQIGVTKQIVGTPLEEGNGSYLINYRQLVCNLSGEPLNNVQLTEDLTQTFRLGAANGVTSFDVVSVSSPATAPEGLFAPGSVYQPLTANAGFNGNDPTAPGGAAPNGVMATGTLPAGGCSVVDFAVRVNVTDPLDPNVRNLGDGVATLDGSADDPAYLGSVVATGIGAASQTAVRDVSDDVTGLPLGTAQFPGDTDGDGLVSNPLQDPANPQSAVSSNRDPRTNPPTDNDPTPTSFNPRPLVPEIGLTKKIVNVVDNGVGPDGRRSYDVTFEYKVCNTGEVPLNGLTVSDNYDEQFRANDTGPVADYQVISVTPGAPTASPPPGSLVANPAAIGRGRGTNELLLANGNALVFAPNTLVNPADGCTGNSAIVQSVVRVFEPDLSAIYDTNAIARGTPTNGAAAVLDLSDDVPQFGQPNPIGGVGTPGPGVNLDDPTPIRFSPLQLFKRITSVTRNGVTETFGRVVGSPPSPTFVGETDIRTLAQLQAGDTVEYTIYYFNASETPLTNVELCDAVPSQLTIVSVPAGTTLAPLTPRGSCVNPVTGANDAGPQGAAVFSVPNIDAGGVGSVRFTSQLR